MVPHKMLNILKWVTEKAQLQFGEKDLERGQQRHKAVEKEAASRRQKGSPY